jgi:hypothetical protein
LLSFRAISVPLTGGDQDPRRAILVAIVLALLALDVGVDSVRDELVGAAGFMLPSGSAAAGFGGGDWAGQ